MEIISNILYIGKNNQFFKDLKALIVKSSNKLNVDIIGEKGELSEILNKKKIHAVVSCLPDYNDCLYIFRLLAMYKTKTNPDLKIIFTSSNFYTFQEIVENNMVEELIVVPWPPKLDEFSKTISEAVLGKKLTKQVVTKTKTGKVTVDLEFIQVFVEATKKVLIEMGQAENLVHHKPQFMAKMDKAIEAGIASKIMISSDFFKGNFYVIFPEPTFLALYENAVYESHDKINEENSDFAGELANIIYGKAKSVLSASGLNLDMAIPSIHRSSQIQSELVIVIPFDSSLGNFYIAVAPGEL